MALRPNDCFMDTTDGSEEEHTGITSDMEAGVILDDCNCDYYKEYHEFLQCFKECGGNPQITIKQILMKMKAAEKPTCLLESSMSSSSKGES